MAEYVVKTSSAEQAALKWAASLSDPPQDPADYFDARMHDVLQSYVEQKKAAEAEPAEAAR